MPDLTLETAWVCASNYYWTTEVTGSKGDVYVVHWGRLPEARAMETGAQHGWQCECKGYKYRGTCKHIAEVEADDRRCCWNAEMDTSIKCCERGIEARCPICGGPVRPVRVAV